MTTISNLIKSLIIAAWMVLLSVFSIQNITPVSLKFLMFESIQFPIGVLLAVSAGGGVILGAIAPLLISNPQKSPRHRFLERD